MYQIFLPVPYFTRVRQPRDLTLLLTSITFIMHEALAARDPVPEFRRDKRDDARFTEVLAYRDRGRSRRKLD